MKGQKRLTWILVCLFLLAFSVALVGCRTGEPVAEVAQQPAEVAQETAPTAEPTAAPPTVEPTVAPTEAPTLEPTAEPVPVAQIEPGAGAWQTWVIESGDQFRPAAPPDEAATAAEIEELVALAARRNTATKLQIDYWNAGPPAYRWNQIAVQEMSKTIMPVPPAARGLALLHAAIYDATIAAWDAKYTYNRPRPGDVDPGLATAIPNPPSPSYPSEYAATAGAAAAVLAYLFPDQAPSFEALAQEATQSRLLAGVEYPSDVEAGLELGRQVAELVIARGMADGSADPWTGSVPTEPGHWTGENPAAPTGGTWQTWVLESGDQFRPAPPPAFDSEQLAAEMEELRAFERTPVTNAKAMFWEHAAGGRRSYWYWGEIADRLVLEAGLDQNPPRAARAYALTNIAGYDAFVACWDAKYEYWALRPFQLDPEFTTVFPTPSHPSYPSAHSCISSAMAGTLAHLFPTAEAQLRAAAEEAGESRIWAGIHFRSDVEAGLALGEDVAEAVIAHATSDGSQ
jgi:membrane-associated phospholipid phosphatase